MNKIIGLVITALVSVIVLAAVLIPTINDATTTHETFKNEGYYRMSAFEHDGTDYTITWAIEKPTIFVINDVEYNMAEILTVTNQYFTMFASDGAYMRVSNKGTDAVVVQCHNSTGNPMLAFDSSSTTMQSMSITIDEDSIDVTRVTDSSITTSANYSEWIYVFDPDGNYMMKDKDKAAYVADEDIIILAGVTNVQTSPATPVGVYGHGTIDNLVIESGYPDDDTVYSNIVINSAAVSGYVKLNTVGDITFDMTRDGTTTAATYSYYLVPVEVTAERSQHLSPAEIEILDILPVFIIIAVLIAAVAAVAFRRE